MTYSDVVYTVKVNVTAVEDRPTATVQVDGKDVEACVLPFENILTGESLARMAQG